MKRPFVMRSRVGRYWIAFDRDERSHRFDTWREAYTHAFNAARLAGAERLVKALNESEKLRLSRPEVEE